MLNCTEIDAGAASGRVDARLQRRRRFHQIGYLLSFKPDAAPAELFASVRRELASVVAARWVRIFPPYSVGATVNKDARLRLRDAFQLPRHGPPCNLMRRMTPG